MANSAAEDELLLDTKQGYVNLLMTDKGLVVTRRKTNALGGVSSHLKISKASSSVKTFPYLQVLAATATRFSNTDPSTLVSVSAVSTSKTKKAAKLWTVAGQVFGPAADHPNGHSKAEEWCRTLEKRAYEDIKPRRRLRVIINPHGGKGKAKELYDSVILPVFRAAGCQITVDYTGPPDSPTNARHYGRDHDYKEYDVLVPVSGDGIVHELINGLASRTDAKAALRATPICPVPAGSGNALQVNLEGPQRANDCTWAALAVIKGKELPVDLCSFTQDGKRTFSFLSQAVGLMADLDLGTEHMRWMGELRFTVGYVQGALARRTYPVEIAVKIAPDGTDKVTMARNYNASASTLAPESKDDLIRDPENDALPELECGMSDAPLTSATEHSSIPESLEPGWHKIKTRIAWAYGGKLPFVSQDLKLFPPASGDNGYIDLVIMPPASRMDALSGMDGAEKGAIYWNPLVRYYRCSAYRLTPLNERGHISVDGEAVPHAPFQVEAHRGLVRCLSTSGTFWSEPIEIREKAAK